MHFDSSKSPFRRWWSQLSAKNLGFNIRSWAKVRILTWVLLMGAGGLALNNNYFELSKHIEIFTTLYREINTYYVDDVDPAKLMKTGIDAMLKSLDPYTDYIPESEIENFKFMTTGQYGGIGALISQNGESIMIADPYEGFPAQKADLRAGDQLLRINGEEVKGRNTEEVSKLLKGQPNTEVKLLISRPGNPKPMEKVLVRQEIKVNSVTYSGMLNSTVGYVNLSAFRVDAGGEIQKAMYELKSKGMKSMVLDLRGNPGGSLDEAVRISGFFVPKGSKVVDTKGKIKEWDKSYNTMADPVDAEMRVVVLVDGSSASASEIVSGVLQDYDRAVVVGQKTFGKGLVQTVRPLTYNSQLKVTTAKYYIPSGRCIQAIEYSDKDPESKNQRVADSLRKAFKTAGGRLVYDAGGVTPDVAIAPDTASNILIALVNKRHVFDFATYLRGQWESIPEPEAFVISDSLYTAFEQFLQGKDYEYITESDKLLKDFKEKATKEKYFDAVAKEYEALVARKQTDKSKDLRKHRREISEYLKQEIVARYYFQKGRLRATFAEDPEVQRALSLLADPAAYKQILRVP
ncbi:MAG: S41 family peptidase [Bacteroidota bacterium]